MTGGAGSLFPPQLLLHLVHGRSPVAKRRLQMRANYRRSVRGHVGLDY